VLPVVYKGLGFSPKYMRKVPLLEVP
jgi:hypothetical protein